MDDLKQKVKELRQVRQKDSIIGAVLALCLFTVSVPLIWLLGGGRWGFAWEEITELVFSSLCLLFAIFSVIYFTKMLLRKKPRSQERYLASQDGRS